MGKLERAVLQVDPLEGENRLGGILGGRVGGCGGISHGRLSGGGWGLARLGMEQGMELASIVKRMQVIASTDMG
jgi:hypothetical protein